MGECGKGWLNSDITIGGPLRCSGPLFCISMLIPIKGVGDVLLDGIPGEGNEHPRHSFLLSIFKIIQAQQGTEDRMVRVFLCVKAKNLIKGLVLQQHINIDKIFLAATSLDGVYLQGGNVLW